MEDFNLTTKSGFWGEEEVLVYDYGDSDKTYLNVNDTDESATVILSRDQLIELTKHLVKRSGLTISDLNLINP